MHSIANPGSYSRTKSAQRSRHRCRVLFFKYWLVIEPTSFTRRFKQREGRPLFDKTLKVLFNPFRPLLINSPTIFTHGRVSNTAVRAFENQPGKGVGCIEHHVLRQASAHA